MTLTVMPHPQAPHTFSAVANMKVSITALIALSCIYWKVSGTLVEVVIRPGDNATLPCDCEIVEGQDIHWVKICSSQIQPPLIISAYDSLLKPIPRFSLFWNNASKSHDLVIENINEADLGVYYCSRVEKKHIEQNRIIFEKDVYHTGDTLINLTYASPENPPEPVCDCWQCWLILQTVCPACSLLSAILAFVCGYRCCHKTGCPCRSLLRITERPQMRKQTDKDQPTAKL